MITTNGNQIASFTTPGETFLSCSTSQTTPRRIKCTAVLDPVIGNWKAIITGIKSFSIDSKALVPSKDLTEPAIGVTIMPVLVTLKSSAFWLKSGAKCSVEKYESPLWTGKKRDELRCVLNG